MIQNNIPDELPDRAKEILDERIPDYCHECGGETVLAGGRLEPEQGIYEHIDPVVMCEAGCWQDRFTAGIDQEEGQQYWVAPGAEEWDELDGMTGWCDMHKEEMVKTKDLLLAGKKIRQFKCPTCDRETTVAVQ